MHGASSWREPPRDIVPVAASDLSSNEIACNFVPLGSPLRKLGSSVKIDAARGVQASVTSTTAPPATVGTRGTSERISQLHSGASGTSSAPIRAASAARFRSTPSASSTVAAA